MRDEPGRTRERKERLRGHIGVSRMECTDGCTMGPPDESEYAVDPVGVERINPSDYWDSVRHPRKSSVEYSTHHSFCEMLSVDVCIYDI